MRNWDTFVPKMFRYLTEIHMSVTPFSLRIFVADGDPDGLRLVERSNWIGKAVMFPRALYTKVRGRDEFKQTGVYLLLGPRTDGDGEMLYIGEGDPVGERVAGALENVTREQLVAILCAIPASWPVQDVELEALGYFLDRRRLPVSARIRQLAATLAG